MRITCHASFDDLAPYQARWNELARGVPFRRWEWLRPWWIHYGLRWAQSTTNGRLWLLAVWDDQQLVAVAPWYQSRVWAEGRVIRALGAGEVCSEYVTILCQPGYEDCTGAVLAGWLTDSAHALGDQDDGWELLELEGVVAGDRTVSRLLHYLTELGNDVYPRTGLSCWRIELPAQWEDVITRLSKSHRKQVRRAARMLADGRALVRHAATVDELQHGFDILVNLHRRRWQSLGEAGCFARPHFFEFHREASALLFPEGCVDLMWVELDGRPLAAEYNLLGSDVLYAYQSGIDPDRLQHEPGRLAIAAALQWAIGRGLRSYDFLRGDEPYKVHWRAQPRPMWEVRVVPKRTSALFRHGVRSATENVKSWIRNGLEIAGLR